MERKIEKNYYLKGLAVATSSTSYLQTLANGEAIAFVTSLQKVKDHLSQELQWMNQQVQQKTVQLRGIETLLSEAAERGLVDSDTHSIGVSAITDIISSSSAEGLSDSELLDDLEIADSNGDGSPAQLAELSDEVSSTSSDPGTNSQQKPESSRKQRSSPSASTKKTSASKAKKSPRSTKPASGESKSERSSGLQQFFQSQFRDKSLTDSVGEILNRSRKPLSANDVMAELYNGLSDEDYKRAKNSVTNILSVGRSKGRWKSTGRGLYAGRAVAIA